MINWRAAVCPTPFHSTVTPPRFDLTATNRSSTLIRGLIGEWTTPFSPHTNTMPSFLQTSEYLRPLSHLSALTHRTAAVDPDEPPILVRDTWDIDEATLAIDPALSEFEGWQLLPSDVVDLASIIRVIHKLRGEGNTRSHPFEVVHAHQEGDTHLYALILRLQAFVGSCQLKRLGNWTR